MAAELLGIGRTSVVYAGTVLAEGTPEEKAMAAAAKIANLPHGGDRKTDQDVDRRLDKNSPENCENNVAGNTELEEMAAARIANPIRRNDGNRASRRNNPN